MALPQGLYSAPATEVDYEMVRRFVLDAEAADLFSESRTFEVKLKRDGHNVAEAVAALANTDGGLVLVGVADRGTGEERLVGIPQSSFDSLVSHLHNLLPDAMPEVIPVATPSKKLIVVLRVDADAVLHPVVVAGRTVYRVPGQTVPADRRHIIDLVQRDNRTGALRTSVPPYPSDEAQFPLWTGDDTWTTAALRVIGGLRLPYRVLERPWLDTPARNAVVDALDSSVIPDRLFELAPMHPQTASWRIIDARSASITLHSPASGTIETAGGVKIDAGARLVLRERRLTLLASLRWSTVEQSQPARLRPQDLYHCLLALICTVSETCVAVAKEIDADTPTEWLPFEGWLKPHAPFPVSDVLDLDQFGNDKATSAAEGHFPRAVPSGQNLDALDQLSRNWLTVLLLELGVRDFEGWLSTIEPRQPAGLPVST